VRVYLDQNGVARLQQVDGGDQLSGVSPDHPVLQGKLARRSASDLSLLIPVVSRQQGFFLQGELGQQITLPLTDVVGVEQKKLSSLKTALTVAGGTAGLAFLVVSIVNGARSPTVRFTPPPPDELRVPMGL
jgi:hypothetical protein